MLIHSHQGETMKKIVKLSLSLFSVLSLVGCTATPTSTNTSVDTSVGTSGDNSVTTSTSEEVDSTTNVAPTLKVSDFSLDKDKKTDVSEYITITDEKDTDLLSKVIISTSSKDILVEGTYLTSSVSGEFTIDFSVSDSDNNTATDSVDVTIYSPYNVFALNATMPPLFSLSTLVSDDTPSLVWIERKGTFDFENLPDSVIASWEADEGDPDLCNSTFTELMNKVNEIGSEDAYSRFTLYRDDVRADLDLYMFLSQGISEDRYQVKMVPDGAWSYNSAISDYTGEDTYAAFKDHQDYYKYIVEQAKAGKFSASDAEYLGDTYYKFTIVMAQRDNFEYLLQYPEYIASKDPLVQAEIEKAHITEAKPDVMYNSLTEDQQEQFRTILSLDKDTFDSTYFTATNGKPYLIITGTNPVTGSLTDVQFENVVDQIVDKYGDEYNFAFKPHPHALLETNTVIQSYFAKNDIVELPGRLPMEALTWVYNNYALGGFDSSLYMCVPTGNTKFFICKDANSLSTVTKNLYNAGMYGDCSFIQPIETTD